MLNVPPARCPVYGRQVGRPPKGDNLIFSNFFLASPWMGLKLLIDRAVDWGLQLRYKGAYGALDFNHDGGMSLGNRVWQPTAANAPIFVAQLQSVRPRLNGLEVQVAPVAMINNFLLKMRSSTSGGLSNKDWALDRRYIGHRL